jgi:hypothetical protein
MRLGFNQSTIFFLAYSVWLVRRFGLGQWVCREGSLRSGLIRTLEEVANEAVCGAREILRLRLGFPHFCPALSLGLGDPLTGFFAQDTLTSPAPVRMTEGT